MKFYRVLSLAAFVAAASALHATEPDYSAWNSLLRKYVHAGTKAGIKANLVRYAALSKDPLWPAAQAALTGFDPEKLSGKKERLAFWINAYNIAAVRKVLEIYPTTSITARGDGVWKAPAIRIAGKDYSLDEIEHKQLRPLGDARIHFAIVCASLSCPDLRTEAYTAAQLEKQLGAQTRAFVANKTKGVRIEADAVCVSAIFNWFAQDFGDVAKFIARFGAKLPGGLARKEISYNWNLNE
ncbi:MAG TPA: DUF547 domain-containing protein [Turneriella sp.]|nr:DUF547 domain-containing protein [Turneriella sp.]HNA78109.1 DUF547 domain-containing protein [Turneriella sp.]HNE19936.1 DUF547 domain-containing protein [Turneriella sp.]HNL09389.1 DUF547 domain-containing protein [Turneriella sp.]HNL54558.1 DUF547 domain-containing protein [Turneriella sp.]